MLSGRAMPMTRVTFGRKPQGVDQRFEEYLPGSMYTSSMVQALVSETVVEVRVLFGMPGCKRFIALINDDILLNGRLLTQLIVDRCSISVASVPFDARVSIASEVDLFDLRVLVDYVGR